MNISKISQVFLALALVVGVGASSLSAMEQPKGKQPKIIALPETGQIMYVYGAGQNHENLRNDFPPCKAPMSCAKCETCLVCSGFGCGVVSCVGCQKMFNGSFGACLAAEAAEPTGRDCCALCPACSAIVLPALLCMGSCCYICACK